LRLLQSKNVASVRQFAENTAKEPLLSEPHAGSRVATTRTMINFRPVEVPVPDNSSSRIIHFSTFEVNLHTGELRHHYQNPDHLDISGWQAILNIRFFGRSSEDLANDSKDNGVCGVVRFGVTAGICAA
jgi:hypothetical protein